MINYRLLLVYTIFIICISKTIWFYADVSAETMSPDTLRGQMQLAVKNNDRPTLERLILIAEEAKYPELGLDIREAREALNKLGGGFGG